LNACAILKLLDACFIATCLYAFIGLAVLRLQLFTFMHVHACAQEIVMYAYFKRLDYFSTECLYAPYAARGYARDFVKDLEVRQGVLLLYTIGSVFVSLVVYS
jgi:hypothetical protein